MTVAELIRRLQCERDDAQVIFATHDYCPEGYPEWDSVRIHEDEDTKKVFVSMDRRSC